MQSPFELAEAIEIKIARNREESEPSAPAKDANVPNMVRSRIG
jgi:hypothetical protein